MIIHDPPSILKLLQLDEAMIMVTLAADANDNPVCCAILGPPERCHPRHTGSSAGNIRQRLMTLIVDP